MEQVAEINRAITFHQNEVSIFDFLKITLYVFGGEIYSVNTEHVRYNIIQQDTNYEVCAFGKKKTKKSGVVA